MTPGSESSLVDERRHGFESLVDWRAVIGRVQIVDVEVVGLQPLQAFIDSAQNGLARESLLVSRVAHLEPHFAGEHNLVALTPSGRFQQRFGDAVLVHVGGVDEINAGFETAIDDWLVPVWSSGLPRVMCKAEP